MALILPDLRPPGPPVLEGSGLERHGRRTPSRGAVGQEALDLLALDPSLGALGERDHRVAPRALLEGPLSQEPH